jgi:hypothetical protein
MIPYIPKVIKILTALAQSFFSKNESSEPEVSGYIERISPYIAPERVESLKKELIGMFRTSRSTSRSVLNCTMETMKMLANDQSLEKIDADVWSKYSGHQVALTAALIGKFGAKADIRITIRDYYNGLGVKDPSFMKTLTDNNALYSIATGSAIILNF